MGFKQPVRLIGVRNDLSVPSYLDVLSGYLLQQRRPGKGLHIEFSCRRHGMLAALAVEGDEVPQCISTKGKISGQVEEASNLINFAPMKQAVR